MPAPVELRPDESTHKEPSMNPTAAIALSTLMLAIGFCGIAHADGTPAPLHRALPKIALPNREDYYPPQAKRSGLEGVVSVAFSIDERGRIVNPSILYSDADVFSAKALRLLSVAHFAVPADWHSSGKDYDRYLFSIRFELLPLCGQLPHFELTDETLDVCGSRIPGSTPHRATEGLSPSSAR
jgi:TonB family protein